MTNLRGHHIQKVRSIEANQMKQVVPIYELLENTPGIELLAELQEESA